MKSRVNLGVEHWGAIFVSFEVSWLADCVLMPTPTRLNGWGDNTAGRSTSFADRKGVEHGAPERPKKFEVTDR